jgi:hypothetical protein
MSDIGQAVRVKFDQVCASELHRLQRKTAALKPAAQAEIAAATYAIARAISAQLAAVLDETGEDGLDEVVVRLFAIATPAAGTDADA